MSGFKSERGQINDNVRTAFTRAMEDVSAQADENAPVDEGFLHASITWRMLAQGISYLRATVGSPLRYAAMRELGGVIKPVRAKRLVWKDREGRFHSATQVIQKPGGRRGSPKYGKPYLKPAVEKFPEFYEKHLHSLG